MMIVWRALQLLQLHLLEETPEAWRLRFSLGGRTDRSACYGAKPL